MRAVLVVCMLASTQEWPSPVNGESSAVRGSLRDICIAAMIMLRAVSEGICLPTRYGMWKMCPKKLLGRLRPTVSVSSPETGVCAWDACCHRYRVLLWPPTQTGANLKEEGDHETPPNFPMLQAAICGLPSLLSPHAYNTCRATYLLHRHAGPD